jgi:hypothetical protein
VDAICGLSEQLHFACCRFSLPPVCTLQRELAGISNTAWPSVHNVSGLTPTTSAWLRPASSYPTNSKFFECELPIYSCYLLAVSGATCFFNLLRVLNFKISLLHYWCMHTTCFDQHWSLQVSLKWLTNLLCFRQYVQLHTTQYEEQPITINTWEHRRRHIPKIELTGWSTAISLTILVNLWWPMLI